MLARRSMSSQLISDTEKTIEPNGQREGRREGQGGQKGRMIEAIDWLACETSATTDSPLRSTTEAEARVVMQDVVAMVVVVRVVR